jgi:hypothetical protein
MARNHCALCGPANESQSLFWSGRSGYGKYLGTAYGDLVIGNYMSEAIYPASAIKTRAISGGGAESGWSRFRYAVDQVIWIDGDSGDTKFNYSELIGNSTSVAISNAYWRNRKTLFLET